MLVTVLKPFNHTKDGYTPIFAAKDSQADVDPKLVQRLADEGFVAAPSQEVPPAPPKPDAFNPTEAEQAAAEKAAADQAAADEKAAADKAAADKAAADKAAADAKAAKS